MSSPSPARLLGCLADDYTGATDIASVLRRTGFTTRVYFDGARGDVPESVDAVVLALKTRTLPVEEAVRQSQEVHRWMQKQGVTKYFVKYCSTMDSTDRGNIGPVIDAVLKAEDQLVSIVVPSYPDNGRTVRDGVLFVNGTPLAQSPMRNHPLTPMTESHVGEILRPQTNANVDVIDLAALREGDALSMVRELRDTPGTHLAIVDAVTNDDIRLLRDVVDELRVITGGAALAMALPHPAPRTDAEELFKVAPGLRLVLSGSASIATQGQVRHAKSHATTLRLDPDDHSTEQVSELVAQAKSSWRTDPERPVLIYATSEPSDVRPEHSAAVETMLATLAQQLISSGARQLIVAGGETSGAVVRALGLTHLDLGPELAPGVLWGAGRTDDGVAINVALKSGNFGTEDMFTSSWKVL